MNKIIPLFILIFGITLPTVFADEEELTTQKITLESDNTAYQEGDVITITGKVEKVITGMPV